MLDVLTDFVNELKGAGLPVSAQEAIDAAVATEAIPLKDARTLRAALSATLLKSAEHEEAFSTTFEIFFSRRVRLMETEIADPSSARPSSTATVEPASDKSADRAIGIDPHEVIEMIRRALETGDERAMQLGARLAVEMFAGIEAGRPVGISYYLFRTLRALDMQSIIDSLIASIAAGTPKIDSALSDATRPLGELGNRLMMEEYTARAQLLRRLIEAAITEALVADRGADAVAKSVRRGALGDVDFMHATKEELALIRKALFPLARLLAARLARSRRHRRRGALDFRATIRRSLSTGGVPIEPRFSLPHPAKPELVVIADVSGSVASFARFTIQLVYAISSQFSKVQSFVFVDGLDEVTSIFRRSSSLAEAIDRIGTEADVTHEEGHSDYGHALSVFCDKYLKQINPRSEVLILGDARNNYHAARADLLAEIARRARHVYWLNPEPRAYWGSGDSIIAEYEPYCDSVVECRNLHQLETFVSALA